MSQFQFDPLPAVQSEHDLHKFLSTLDQYFKQLGQAKTQLDWDKKMEETFDADRQDQIDHGYDQLYCAPNHEVIRTWKTQISEPFLKRWLDVLDWDFTLARIDQNPDLRAIKNHIDDRYIHWRPKIDGKEIPYTEQTLILRQDPDRDRRRKAWMAQWELNEELEEKTKAMFRIRNQAANDLGYDDFAELQLAADGVNRDWLVTLLEEMEQTTDPIYTDYLEKQMEKAGITSAEPWDIQYFFDRDPWPDPRFFPGDQLKAHLNNCLRSLGENPDELGIEIYWYDSPYGGQCVPYADKDIRILTNYGDGMLYYHTAYHEYGHALHNWYNEQPFSLSKESGMFSEGMAQLMALFLHYPSQLRRAGMDEEAIRSYRETRKLPWMYRHRRIAADVMAELAVWENPEGDLDHFYGQSTERFLKTNYHPRPFSAVPRWTNPVRMQSYFIADLISCQTHAYLRKNFQPLFENAGAFEHVRTHYWKPGKSIDWREKVHRCTEEPLTYQYLAREMTDLLPDG